MPTICLDLDQTLIFANASPVENATHIHVTSATGAKLQYWVRLRPHLNQFLAWCFKHFKVGVWSSGSLEYITEIVKLFPQAPAFILHRDDCVQRYQLNKSLRKRVVQYVPTRLYYKQMEKIVQASHSKMNLMIDDSPDVIIQHPNVHYIPIGRYTLETVRCNEFKRIKRVIKYFFEERKSGLYIDGVISFQDPSSKKDKVKRSDRKVQDIMNGIEGWEKARSGKEKMKGVKLAKVKKGKKYSVGKSKKDLKSHIDQDVKPKKEKKYLVGRRMSVV